MTASELRQYRARHRLTQDEVGAILGPGVNRLMVSRYERGILKLSPEDAAKLYLWEAAGPKAQEVPA